MSYYQTNDPEHFRVDNTEGYSISELNQLNLLLDNYMEENNVDIYDETLYKSAMELILSKYDSGVYKND